MKSNKDVTRQERGEVGAEAFGRPQPLRQQRLLMVPGTSTEQDGHTGTDPARPPRLRQLAAHGPQASSMRTAHNTLLLFEHL